MSARQHRLTRYLRILRIIAQEKVNKYRICKTVEGATEDTEPTILYAIRDLESWGMMNQQKTGKRARGGGEAYYYYLTKVGLASLLGFVSQENGKGFVERLSITQRDLLWHF